MANKNLIIMGITVFFLLIIPTISAKSCSCSSYPCSQGTCSGDFCDSSDDFAEYTGSCLYDGFLGGYCEEDVIEYCSVYCDDSLGCFECLDDGHCSSDYYYCSGNDKYKKDFTCSMFNYMCYSSDVFIEDCDDRDGNYCNGQSRELRNYFCSGVGCNFGITTTTDCSVYTTDWSDFECITSDLSYKERDLGVCDLLDITWCDTVLDTVQNSCFYGCASGSNEKEYKYDCSDFETYYKYNREIEGYCKKESGISWSVESTAFNCPINYMCENDNIIDSSSPPNPCERFSVSLNINQTTITTGSDFTIQSTSTQTFSPNVLLYDYTNDGVYDIGYGSGCDILIQNMYCNGDACCHSGSPFNAVKTITASIPGEYELKVLALENIKGWSYFDVENYIVSSAYVVAFIDSLDLVINKSTPISLDDFSYGDPSITAQCWRDGTYKYECYGDSDDCVEFCPGYDYENPFWYYDFDIDTQETGIRTVSLLSTNGNQSDTDIINVCVYDYANNEYCGTCNDGILNDDETTTDKGGHCGTCSDGIQNGIETYIDYGGNCGTCFDNTRQSFELIDIDYGGICGNCTGSKNQDTYWGIGHSLDNSVPFDYGYCGSTTDGVIGVVQVITILVLFLLLTFIIFLLGIIGVFAVLTLGSFGLLVKTLIKDYNKTTKTKKQKERFK